MRFCWDGCLDDANTLGRSSDDQLGLPGGELVALLG
jgi:hypothetical protein